MANGQKPEAGSAMMIATESSATPIHHQSIQVKPINHQSSAGSGQDNGIAESTKKPFANEGTAHFATQGNEKHD